MKLRIIAILIIGALCTMSISYGATPSPKKTVKSVKKSTVKPAAKSKSSSKSSTKSGTTSSSKASSKASSKSKTKSTPKKTYWKPKPRKKIKLSPRKDSAWPPTGFTNKGDIFAKIPSAREVLDAATTDSKLRKQLNTKICDQKTCGAVMVASVSGCVWWEIKGDVVGATSDTDKSIKNYGKVRTLYGSTLAKEIKTILIVSDEDRKLQHQIVNIDTLCHMDNPTETIPS